MRNEASVQKLLWNFSRLDFLCQYNNNRLAVLLPEQIYELKFGGKVMAKTVPVKKHKRSTPSSPPHKGPGRKPGPKPVPVKKHKRSLPN